MFFIRQGATHKVVIGPVVAVANGYVPVTTLAVSSADEAEAILHDNGTVVDISGYTFAAIATADGYYHLTLQSGISGTVGHMTVVINDDSLCLPVKAEFTVLEEAVYDALYAASAPGYLQPTIAGRTLDVSAGGEAGVDWANVGSPSTAVNLSATNIDVDQVVASVSGAVGSVTGAVGSVTGNVGGNVAGSVGSVTGAVGSVTGAVGSVTGSVGSVTGAVGSVTGLTASDVGAIKAKTDSLTFTVANQVDANVQYVNDVAVTGTGALGDEWGP